MLQRINKSFSFKEVDTMLFSVSINTFYQYHVIHNKELSPTNSVCNISSGSRNDLDPGCNSDCRENDPRPGLQLPQCPGAPEQGFFLLNQNKKF